MAKRGLSQKDLLADSNGTLDGGNLSKVLSKKGSVPTLTIAAKYAAAIGLTLAEFYSEKELSEYEKAFAEPIAAMKDFIDAGATKADVNELVNYLRFRTGEVRARGQPGIPGKRSVS